ncbi:hypothetical protein FRC02_007837 [Tulasnella sp. 418]|nr:hypothetical protein FRC02_007837 [Tulasnella sp. 418]
MTRITHSLGATRNWRNATSIRVGRQPLDRLQLQLSKFSTQPPKRPRNVKETRFILKLGFFCLTTATAGISALVYWTSGGHKASRSASTSSVLPLAYSHFTPTLVTRVEDSGEPTKLITLKVPVNLVPQTGTDPVYTIYVKDSDIQVERPYTPLKGIEEDGEMTFWIKRYERGEVGRWMNRRKVGDVVEVRGPVRTFDWSLEENKWDEVVLVSSVVG